MKKFITCILVISILCSFIGCINESTKENSGKDTIQKTTSGTTKEQKLRKADYFIKVGRDRPYGVVCDSKGLMYMVTAPDSGNGILWKVAPNGTAKEFAELEGDFVGNTDLDKSFISSGIDTDTKGNVYITLGDRLLKILPDGKVETMLKGFSRCFDVKIDLKGNMFVADDKADTIYKFTPSMEKGVFYKGNEKTSFVLTSLVFDRNYENLYAREGRKILKFSLNSDNSPKPKVIADNIGVFDICIDNENNIYASTGENVIKKIDLDGNVSELDTQGLISTSVGINIGKTGFGETCLYVACANGIVNVPLEK